MQQFLRTLLKILRWSFTPLCIGFAIYLVIANRELLAQLMEGLRASFMLGAVVGWMSLNALAPLVVFVVMRRSNDWLRFRHTLSIHVSRLPARYLPGGVWHTVARFADYHSGGADLESLRRLLVVESITPPAVALTAGALALLCWGDPGSLRRELLFLLAGTSLLLALLPCFLNGIGHRLCGRIHWRDYLAVVVMVAAFWTGAASVFVVYLSGFEGIAPADGPLHVAGSYALAWGIGNLAVFAPQGIGVFEVVAGSLIEFPLELGGAAIVLAGFRLLVFCADILSWLIFFVCSALPGFPYRRPAGDRVDDVERIT